jgi:hypothetical protein
MNTSKVAGTMISLIALTAPAFAQGRPDIANPARYATSAFSFKYPGNWRVDVVSKVGPEIAYSIHSQDGNVVGIRLLQSTNAQTCKEDVQFDVQNLSKAGYEVRQIETFKSWGQLSGYGLELSYATKDGSPVHHRIFEAAHKPSSITVNEIFREKDLVADEAGLKLIQSTFAFSGQASKPK